MDAQIKDLQRKFLICKESENDTFRFPWSKKPRMDFLRPYHGCNLHQVAFSGVIRLIFPLMFFSATQRSTAR